MSQVFKLLILDYGGVYSFGNSQDYFNTIMVNAFGREPTMDERQKISEKSRLLGANKITIREYIVLVSDILAIPQLPTVRQFEDATMAATSSPSPEMVRLVRAVRQSGIKVSLLSDMYLFEAKRTRPWGRYEGFDYVSLSAEAGMTKHDPEFFNQTLTHFDVVAKDALFVDDTMNNIEVAKTVGLATLWADKNKFNHAAELAREIRQCLAIA